MFFYLIEILKKFAYFLNIIYSCLKICKYSNKKDTKQNLAL